MIKFAKSLRRWWLERSLGPEARSVRAEGLTYLDTEKFRRIEIALSELNRDQVPGAFVEFGIALGGSAIVIATAAKGRGFHGFDVFGMIPEPTSDKDDAKSKERYTAIKSGQSKGLKGDIYYGYRPDLYSEVCESFARHGVPVDDKMISLHKGLFEESWPKASIRSIALAHLDCDWYDPVKYCLSAVADKLSQGGAIVIDDYYAYGGCKAAVDEFLASRQDFAFEKGSNPILRKWRRDSDRQLPHG